MLSFVWSSKYPFIAGSGGSETYTAGHIRELNRRGIPARLITIGFGENDGRADFPDIEFLALDNEQQLAELDDTIVYVIYPLKVTTKHPAYAILHCPPPNYARGDSQYNIAAFKGVRLITASKFSAGIWRRYLRSGLKRMPTVYPFADRAFSEVARPVRQSSGRVRILYAGRLTPDKGIYTLLAALHMEALQGVNFELHVTTAGNNAVEGKIVYELVQAHPLIKVIRARRNTAAMAKLLAKSDVVVMPSTAIYWQEMFGMLSVEAQHAGCRVVASRSGGLPETNLGGVILVTPDNPLSLAAGMAQAIARGPLTARERAAACRNFTVVQSVDKLLQVVSSDRKVAQSNPEQTPLLRKAAL